MQGLTEGRMVHYILPDGAIGQHRPAIVVKVWDREAGTINLRVFYDGTNDFLESDGTPPPCGSFWATSVRFDAAGVEAGTWHWIEPA
jgi:hypothetical protein